MQEYVGNIIADKDIITHVGLMLDASEENLASICITHYLVIDYKANDTRILPNETL